MHIADVKVSSEFKVLKDLLTVGRQKFEFSDGKAYYIHNGSHYAIYLKDGEEEIRILPNESAGYVKTSNDLEIATKLPASYEYPRFVYVAVSDSVVAEKATPIGGFVERDTEGAYVFRGSVDKREDLPEKAQVGDVYNIINESGMNVGYTKDGTWDNLGATFDADLTVFALKTEVTAEFERVDAALELKASQEEVTEALTKKAEQTDFVALSGRVDEINEVKATKEELNAFIDNNSDQHDHIFEEIEKKVNQVDYDAKVSEIETTLGSIIELDNSQASAINALGESKAEKSEVNAAVEALNTKNDTQDNAIDALANAKADKAEVSAALQEINSALNEKAVKTEVNAAFAEIDSDIAEIDVKVAENESNIANAVEAQALLASKAEVEAKEQALQNAIAEAVAAHADLATKAEVEAVAAKLAGVYHFRGSVASRADLPTDAEIGDVYDIADEDGMNVGYKGNGQWDNLGSIFNPAAIIEMINDLAAVVDAAKAEHANFATKVELAELAAAVETKAVKSDVDAALATKADKTDLVVFAEKEQVESQLNLKADKTDLEFYVAASQFQEHEAANESAFTAINTELSKKAVKSDVDAALDLKATKEEVESEFAAFNHELEVNVAALEEGKADRSDLETLASKAELQALDEAKASKESVQEVAGAKADKSDLESLATKDELQQVAGAIPDISPLASKEELQQVAESIPSIEGLATEDSVTAEAQARQAADADIISHIWSKSNMNQGYFQTKYTHQNGSHAMLWNESDGGGSQTFDKTANIVSYVGTNLEEGNSDKDGAINVQIYSKDKASNEGVRINVNSKKAYYLQGANKANVDSRELAVKADIDELAAQIPAVDGLATKDELQQVAESIPSIEGLATEAQVQEVANAIPDVSGFATQQQLALKLDKSEIFDSTGVFNTVATAQDGTYSKIWNELNSGGGSQIYNAPRNFLSYVGVNKSSASDPVDVQIYAKDKSTNIGTRLNVSATDGMFYLKNCKNLGVPAGREVVVKDDIAGFAEATEVDKKATTIDALALAARLAVVEERLSELSKTSVEQVAITPEVTTLADDTKDYILSGDVVATLRVTGKSAEVSGTQSNDARLNITAGDVEIKNYQTSGAFAKATSNATISISSDGYVTVRDAVIDGTMYNGIEIGLANGKEVKGVTIENCDFKGKFSNNAISIFAQKDGAVVNINNCHFEEVSNALRLSNKSNTKVTVNITNCTCDKWEANADYAGFILCQDYTSASAEAAATNNLFAPEKVAINISNFVGPYGKLVEPDSIAEIAGCRDAEKQFIYVYRDKSGLVNYSADTYPALSIS